ncbi:hypothetical protein TNCV_459191 [Trichonephila clavipes]|nr:hypothetical protein TNCV_459191 [Trichonephila clavipes]
MDWVDPKINDPRGILVSDATRGCDRSFHFAMARTKQTGFMESGDQILEVATKTTKIIKEKILTMEFVQTDQQICEYLDEVAARESVKNWYQAH